MRFNFEPLASRIFFSSLGVSFFYKWLLFCYSSGAAGLVHVPKLNMVKVVDFSYILVEGLVKDGMQSLGLGGPAYDVKGFGDSVKIFER